MVLGVSVRFITYASLDEEGRRFFELCLLLLSIFGKRLLRDRKTGTAGNDKQECERQEVV